MPNKEPIHLNKSSTLCIGVHLFDFVSKNVGKGKNVWKLTMLAAKLTSSSSRLASLNKINKKL